MPRRCSSQIGVPLGQVVCRIRRGGGRSRLPRYLCRHRAVDGREDSVIEALRQGSPGQCGGVGWGGQGPDPGGGRSRRAGWGRGRPGWGSGGGVGGFEDRFVRETHGRGGGLRFCSSWAPLGWGRGEGGCR